MHPLTFYGTPVQFPDGDGFSARIESKIYTCRLAWIDAPEMDQRWGPEARATLYHLIHGQRLSITQLTNDKWLRLIVMVKDEAGHLINDEMVRLGCAWYQPRYGKGPACLARSQAMARANRIGLWQFPNPTNPRDHRMTRHAILSSTKTPRRNPANAQAQPKPNRIHAATRPTREGRP